MGWRWTMRAKATLILVTILSVLLVLSGCNGDGGGGPMYVAAGVETEETGTTTAASVIVNQGGEFGTPVSDATVTVNGTALTYFDFGGLVGIYVGSVAPAVSEQESVTLHVQRGGSSISATLQMPEKPQITAPTTAGGPYDPSQSTTVSWTSTTDPDIFTIYVEGVHTASGVDYEDLEAGSEPTHVIPSGTFLAGKQDVVIEVSAVNKTMSLGADAEAGSVYAVGYQDMSQPFDIQ
jgi:hypothetical protein